MSILNALGLGVIKRDWVGVPGGTERHQIFPAEKSSSLRVGAAVGLNSKGQIGPLNDRQIGFAGFIVERLEGDLFKVKTRGALELALAHLEGDDRDRVVFVSGDDTVHLDPGGFPMGRVVNVQKTRKGASAHVWFHGCTVFPLQR